MDIKKLLKGTEYEDSAACIATYVERARIRDADGLDELPGRVGARVCGHNTYTLVARLKDQLADAKDGRSSGGPKETKAVASGPPKPAEENK